MIATKPWTYATRRLVPGDRFEVPDGRMVQVVLATKKAKIAESAPAVAAAPIPRPRRNQPPPSSASTPLTQSPASSTPAPETPEAATTQEPQG
jgi:hypothetical protein